MRGLNAHEKKIRELLGHQEYPPAISFYDHAVIDKEASEASGRPRYNSKVYIQKIPTAPDKMVRDTFSRAMEEQDKSDYPEEWALYQERKQAIDNADPPVRAVPGMNVAFEAELRDLGVFTCKQLVNYPKPLENMDHLREIARRILTLADEILHPKAPVLRPVELQHNGHSFAYEFTV